MTKKSIYFCNSSLFLVLTPKKKQKSPPKQKKKAHTKKIKTNSPSLGKAEKKICLRRQNSNFQKEIKQK